MSLIELPKDINKKIDSVKLKKNSGFKEVIHITDNLSTTFTIVNHGGIFVDLSVKFVYTNEPFKFEFSPEFWDITNLYDYSLTTLYSLPFTGSCSMSFKDEKLIITIANGECNGGELIVTVPITRDQFNTIIDIWLEFASIMKRKQFT